MSVRRERPDGVIEYVNNQGTWHREDGPAVIYPKGTESWYWNGKRHRDGGPAVIRSDSSKEWWANGTLHRYGDPAIEWADGTKEWYRYGQRHRKDGPAIEYPDGSKEWWLNQVKMVNVNDEAMKILLSNAIMARMRECVFEAERVTELPETTGKVKYMEYTKIGEQKCEQRNQRMAI